MSKRRVVVTGLGHISPIGNTVEAAWQSLIAGKSGIAPITRFDASQLNTQFAGEVKDLDIEGYIPRKEARHMDFFMQYGVAAALQAIADAKLDDYEELDKTRVGVIIGSGIGGVDNIEQLTLQLEGQDKPRVSPFFIPSTISNLIAGHITLMKGYRGPSYALSSACTTGTHSIGDTVMMIQSGRILSLIHI